MATAPMAVEVSPFQRLLKGKVEECGGIESLQALLANALPDYEVEVQEQDGRIRVNLKPMEKSPRYALDKRIVEIRLKEAIGGDMTGACVSFH